MREFKFTWSKLVLCLVPVIFCLTIPMALLYLTALESASPRGTGGFGFAVGIMIIVPGCLLIASAFITGCVCLAYPRSRLIGLACIASSVSLFIGGLAGGEISNRIQKNTLTQLAERSKPLIAAIKSYEQKFGHPPDSLNTLVPDFIPKVPNTGIGVSPEYKYQSLTNSSSYGNNKWVLEVYHAAEADPLCFDTLIYLPLQDYSILSPRHQGDIRRIGDWAYWHRG